MGKSNFLFYNDWYEVIRDFAPEERLQLYDAIMLYAFEGVMPEDKFVKVATALMRSTIDRDNDKYEAIIEKRREAGRRHRGNQYSGQMEQNGTSEANGTNGTDNDNVNDNDISKDINNKKKTTKKEKFDFGFCSPDMLEAVQRWLEYKAARRETYKTQTSLEAFYKKLVKLSEGDPQTAEAIIEESMANNWQGIFALRGETKPVQPANVKLGPGERIENGRRTYGTGRVTIPMNAPARPDERWSWNAETQKWEL